ncbi:MAG: hypothetical protein Q4P07_02200 [Ornithinimicrobium sp.]|uniref:hypothetical protein n=1 Tax=Ornithinimicrobium sp. TaxID=1977084 RepID=UPI0026E0F438|nr:hypothetical protein [Ornithinimicrobium sp.]MDO5738940.1 hypothetical protein [Ornithinimicrobium sp.]
MGGHRHDDQLSAFVGRHALDLHRTARMLTGDTDRADVLTARAVRRSARTSSGPVGLDEARAGLVQDFLRTAHRHRWGRPSFGISPDGSLGADAGEVVAGMPPRERAASVLGLVHGWAPARVGRAVGVRTRKVASQISSVSGVRDALEAVADRHDTSEQDLVETLLTDLRSPPESPVTPAGAALPVSGRLRSLRGHWRLLLLAGLVLILAGAGWALTHNDPRDPAATGRVGTAQSMPEVSLASRGWELDARGKAPTSNEGLQLLQSVTIDYGNANAPLELMGGNHGKFAKFAVLWCDLPAVDDPHLVIPALTMTFDEGPVTLPCAGRQGQPPVTRLTPTPFGLVSPQDASLTWTGDLPGRGKALLAFYYEVNGADDMLAHNAAVRQGNATEPAVPAGSVPVTKDSPSIRGWWGRTYVQKVEITHDSAVSAWAGSSAALIVTVDGQPLTDDGDLRAWNGATPADLWHQQDPMLRDGAWLVYGPDQARTFALPDTLRPGPGERRTVVVTTLVQDSDEVRWQVQVSDATPIPQHTTSIEASSGPGLDPSTQAPVPYFVGGHRFVARWDFPADGYPYDLQPPGSSVESALFMTALDTDSIMQFVQGPYGNEGSVQSEFGTAYLSFSYQLVDNFSYPRDAWGMPPPKGQEPGSLRAALQALPGQPMAPLWAFEPVPYEDFDFTDAPPLPSSWPAHEDKPLAFEGQRPPPLGHGTLKNGVVTLEGEGRPRFAVVTTQGKGRLRMLISGQPIEELEPHRGGWWSSWTEEPVTSELYLGEGVGDLDDLTIEVEGYDQGFAIELFPDGSRR